MLRRIRLICLWCVLVLLVGVAPAAAEEGSPSAGEPEPGVVVAEDGVAPPRPPLPVAGLPDPDAGRSGLTSGSASVALAAGAVVAAEGLPVWVELTAGKATVAEVQVLAGEAVAVVSSLGVGVWVDLVDPAASEAGTASARVVLDYSQLRLGYAAGLAGRLRVLRGVDCEADEKGAVACADLLPVEAANDTLKRVLSFELSDADLRPVSAAGLEAVSGGGGGFFVLSSGPSGEGGDFGATPLSVLTSYQVGLVTGHFEVSYPIGVPPAFWGPEPDVTLSYSSGAVDGLTGDLNTQAGWLGLGWDFHPGSVSRQFGVCDGCGASGDLVPAGDLFSLSVGGVSSRLVEVDATNRIFRLEADPEWRVQLLSGASNGDQQGEYWVVTTPAGLRYTFGRETVSGSDSAFVVPVYSPSGDGYGWCAGVSGNVCDKVWQWNLESIEDPNGYRVEFLYVQESNWFKAGTSSTLTDYVRGGTLSEVRWGDGPGKDHHARALFTRIWRCEPTDTECDTWAERSGDMSESQQEDGTLFPDVPVDLICDEGESCSQQGPTFFSHRALGRILTQYWSGSAWVDVDRWDLTFSFAPGPEADTAPPEDPEGDASQPKLALMAVQKMDVGGSAHLNPVEFGYQWRPNRADYAVGGVSAQYMARLDSITNELGGVTTVAYGKSADCVWGYPFYPGQPNTYDPDYNDTDPSNNVDWYGEYGFSNVRRTCDEFPGLDPQYGEGFVYWEKWKALQVTRQATGESPAQTSTYTYLTFPTWHHWDNLVDPSMSFWRDWRGHRQVQVTDSSGAYVVHTFYLGMKGDDWPTFDPVPEATFVTSESGAPTRQDEDWLAGRPAEAHRHASGGASLSRVVSYYTWDQTSAEDTWWSAPSQQLTTTWGSSTSVTTQTDWTYLDLAWFHGLSDETRRGVAGTDQVRRTHTSWLQSTLAGYDPYYLPNQIQIFDAASGGVEVARTRLFYDGANSNYLTRPGRGNPTRTRIYSQLTPTEISASTWTSYDPTALWPTSTTDPNGLVTYYDRDDTIYGYVSVETVQAADPDRDFITTTVLDPGRGGPLSVTQTNSPNNTKTSYAYDTHGRLAKVWKPTRHDTSGVPLSVPSFKFFYSTPSPGMASVHTQTLSGTGAGFWLDSYTFFDGFGRQIQTQTPDPAGGSLLTSTRYNSVGLPDFASGGYHSSATAGAGWVDPTWTAVGPYTNTIYDGAGRPLRTETWSGSTELWESTSAYGVTSGRSWVTQTDAEGRWLTDYFNGHGELALVEEPDGGDVTYTYTPRGELASVTNDYNTPSTADDITIQLSYDLAGRKVAMSDPDSGAWSYTYDPAGRLTTQTDGRGTEITLVRDDLGRVTRRKDTTGTNNITLAVYTYDVSAGVDYAWGRLVTTQAGASAGVADTKVNDFNADGLPLSQTWTLDQDTNPNDVDSYTAGFTYTKDDKPATVVYPSVNDGSQALDAETVTYGYDGAGRPESITSSFDSNYTYLRDTSYTEQGLPSYWALGPLVGGQDTAERHWVYDSTTLRVSELRAGSYPYNPANPDSGLQRLAYTYDQTGLVTRIVDYKNSQQRQCYTYNSRSMLTHAFTGNSGCTSYDSATGANPFDQTYTYNAVGNITQLGSTTGWTYGTGNQPGAGDAGPHAVTAAGGIAYTYDDTGNQTGRTQSGATTGYTYNQDNRLTTIDVPASTLDWTFGYDADGNRVIVQHGSGAFTYHIGGLLEVDTTTAGGTVTQTRSLYPLGGGVTAVRVNTKTGGSWDPNGPDEINYTFADHLGSVASILEISTTPTYTRHLQRYYPWGEPRTTYSPGLPTHHTYTGQQADIPGTEGGNPSGLMYYNARYYNPALAHFTQPDTLIPDASDPQAYNRYQYVRNNPTNLTDPTGHGGEATAVDWVSVVLNALAAAGAVAVAAAPFVALAAVGTAVICAAGALANLVMGPPPPIPSRGQLMQPGVREIYLEAVLQSQVAAGTIDPRLTGAYPDLEKALAAAAAAFGFFRADDSNTPYPPPDGLNPDWDHPDSPPGEGWERGAPEQAYLDPAKENWARYGEGGHGPHFDYGRVGDRSTHGRLYPDGHWAPKRAPQ